MSNRFASQLWSTDASAWTVVENTTKLWLGGTKNLFPGFCELLTYRIMITINLQVTNFFHSWYVPFHSLHWKSFGIDLHFAQFLCVRIDTKFSLLFIFITQYVFTTFIGQVCLKTKQNQINSNIPCVWLKGKYFFTIISYTG